MVLDDRKRGLPLFPAERGDSMIWFFTLTEKGIDRSLVKQGKMRIFPISQRRGKFRA